MAAQPRPRWLLRALSAAVMWWQLWLWRAMPPGDWNKKTEIFQGTPLALMKCYSSMFVPYLSRGDYDITFSFVVM